MERQTSLSFRQAALVAAHEWHSVGGLVAPSDAALQNCCPALRTSTAPFLLSMVQQFWILRLLCPVHLMGAALPVNA